MKRRGFTLIELGIVISIMAILLVSTTDLIVQLYREHDHVAQLAQLKTSTTGAAHKAMQKLDAGPFTFDTDNKGLKFASGDSLRWKGKELIYTGASGERSIWADGVLHFSAYKRGPTTTLTFELETPRTDRGAQPYRATFDYPRRDGS